VVTENEFEKKLLADVIPPSDIGVTFDDIGALENVKDTLKELVMLPLQRPELFCKGQLTKVTCKIQSFFPATCMCVSVFTRWYSFYSLAREYCFLGLLVLGKQCSQRLLQLRLVQTL
jgi:hypothetical protein